MIIRRPLLALVVTLAALVGPAGPASAHDVLISTNPAGDSTVRTLPSQVKLTFNEAVLGIGTAVQVKGPDGDVATGPAKVVNSTVSQPVGADAPAGDYTVTWRVTSADGHPISGTFAFTTSQGSTTTAAPSTTTAAPAPAAATAPVPADDTSGAPSPWVWVIVGVVLVVLLAGVVLLVRRRPAEE